MTLEFPRKIKAISHEVTRAGNKAHLEEVESLVFLLNDFSSFAPLLLLSFDSNGDGIFLYLLKSINIILFLLPYSNYCILLTGGSEAPEANSYICGPKINKKSFFQSQQH
jgi:hypothetical protein